MPNKAQLLLLDTHQVAQLMRPDDALHAVREAFILHSQRAGRSFPLIREKLPHGSIFGIKAGSVDSQSLLGFKAAGFWPDNRPLGKEPHQATILLIDPATGRPLCVIDGNAITTLRTGAAGGLGLQHLARPDSRHLCVFGSGVQARVQTQFALRLLPALRCVRYLTADGRRNTAFEASLEASRPEHCTIVHASAADDAVAASDVVITATPGKGPLFSAAALKPGTHLNCVGSDTIGKRELPAGLLQRVRLFVDDTAQARQIGETQWAPETPSSELGDLLSGTTPFSRHADDITLFDMTGLALQDLTLARLLLQRAETSATGTRLPWPW
jgi:alanine dehydrogenase